jgi:methionyl-tRNA formyltransferase
MQSNSNNFKWAFFGTSKFSVIVLEELKKRGYSPSLIITSEDKPKGRKLSLTPSDVKVWAKGNSVAFIEPKSLKTDDVLDSIKNFLPDGFDFFVVASYGKIIPKNILDIPRSGTLNVHPSLLPKLRGASPIQNAILRETETGVTIILLDEQMDHGPIITQKKLPPFQEIPYEADLENTLAILGGNLLADVIPDWIQGKLETKEQNHAKATLCKKIEKEDAQLNLDDSAELNLRIIRAYHIWPGAYYFLERGNKKTRIIIKRAHIEDNKLIIDRIIPEGKKEMNYVDFMRNVN